MHLYQKSIEYTVATVQQYRKQYPSITDQQTKNCKPTNNNWCICEIYLDQAKT